MLVIMSSSLSVSLTPFSWNNDIHSDMYYDMHYDRHYDIQNDIHYDKHYDMHYDYVQCLCKIILPHEYAQ